MERNTVPATKYKWSSEETLRTICVLAFVGPSYVFALLAAAWLQRVMDQYRVSTVELR